tara:strand:- start:787 stop:912 length:126 start_codon:yes stop_codon:yes gene_type:complete
MESVLVQEEKEKIYCLWYWRFKVKWEKISDKFYFYHHFFFS